MPRSGPVLLVANHPNSLLDPAFVAAAAGRPVRFLAKAPLFTDPAVAWLVRASGAIPIHRASEDPTAAARNADVFREVYSALAEGAAVGIFPEGTTHTQPSMVPLKTGAARMALGGARLAGRGFPIIPVGLTLRDKERFRSDALVIVGEPVQWDDLQNGDDDPAAVRELTSRIDTTLRRITVNVEQWEDRLVLETAEAIYAAEFGSAADPVQRVGRLHEAAQMLTRVRRTGHQTWEPLAGEVEDHRRMLEALGASPGSLDTLPPWGTAVRWMAKKMALWVLAGPVLLLGGALFWIPYRTPGWVVAHLDLGEELRATYKALIGFVAFTAWLVAMGATIGWVFGPAAAAAMLAVMPLLAAATLGLWDRWHDMLAVARRFLQLRRGGELRAHLRERQRELARRLDELFTRASEPVPDFR